MRQEPRLRGVAGGGVGPKQPARGGVLGGGLLTPPTTNLTFST